MDKKCLECGEPMQGRSDKKFCSDQCRTTYYNRQNADTTNFMRNVNRVLRKNRKILAGLNPAGKAKVSKGQLLDEGFNFNYFTNVYKTKSGKVYYFCYEQGYLPIENNHFALVIRQEYVK